MSGFDLEDEACCGGCSISGAVRENKTGKVQKSGRSSICRPLEKCVRFPLDPSVHCVVT